ncbi:sensor histidine kinase [Sporolactobacillus terrae]|nr:GHKL domain-containing protein [Sporolactobacillus terrae]
MPIDPFKLFLLDVVTMSFILGGQNYLYGLTQTKKIILYEIGIFLLALLGIVFSSIIGWTLFFTGIFILFLKVHDRRFYFLNLSLILINNVFVSNLSAIVTYRIFRITPLNSSISFTWVVLEIRLLIFSLFFTTIVLLLKLLIKSRFFQLLLENPNSQFSIQAIAFTCLLIQIIDLLAKYFGVLVAYLGLTVILFFLLAVFSIVMLYFYFRMRQKEQDIQFEQEQKRIFEQYMKNLEESFNLLRSFKHDYQNLLLSLETYIQEGDLKELKRAFNELQLNSNLELSRIPDDYKVLTAIHNKSIKGILLAKIYRAHESGISVSLEVSGTPSFPENKYEMVRMLGILLDNAIEASVMAEHPKIRIAVISESNDLELIIANSYTPSDQIDVNKIFKRGYTTKANNSGIGLNIVKQMVDRHPNMFLEAESDPSMFTITIVISG